MAKQGENTILCTEIIIKDELKSYERYICIYHDIYRYITQKIIQENLCSRLSSRHWGYNLEKKTYRSWRLRICVVGRHRADSCLVKEQKCAWQWSGISFRRVIASGEGGIKRRQVGW